MDELRQHRERLIELLQQEAVDARHRAPYQPSIVHTLSSAGLMGQDIERIVAAMAGGMDNVQDIYPLAPLQEGVLYHHLSAEQGDAYLLQAQYVFSDEQRLRDFAGALQQVIDRHDVLRTSLLWETLDAPVQVVWRQAALQMEQVDCDPAQGDALLQLQRRYDARRVPMDLAKAPLLKLVWAHDQPNRRWVGVLLFHHLILDHLSLQILRQELQVCLLGRAEQLPPPIPYRSYVMQAREGTAQERHRAFFAQRLEDVDEASLPFGLANLPGDGAAIQQASRSVAPELARQIKQQARLLGVTAASVFHLAWAQVVARTSGRSDVVFGTVLLGRMQGAQGAGSALGLFVNTLPLRLRLDQPAHRAVRQAHAELTAVLAHEHAPLSLAQRCSGIAPPAPLFSALLNYRHSPTADATAEAQQAWHGIDVVQAEERTHYPLTLNVDDLGDGFALTAQVPPEIGADRICDYMHTALERLVQALEGASEQPVAALEILPEAEWQRLVSVSNTPCAQAVPAWLLHERFEAQAAAHPDAIAVEFEQQQISYGQLNARANQIAHALLKMGVRPDDRVALCVERGIALIAGMLAILKSGAGYVPLDPASPPQRLAFMLEDSAPVALLGDSLSIRHLPPLSCPILDLDAIAFAEPPAPQLPNPGPGHLSARHLAYVIYTSGSSGRPKGVLVEHGNVTRLFTATEDWFGFGPADTWALFHSFAFDFSVWEIWGALLYGGRLLIVPQHVARAPQECYRLLCRSGVSILNQTPSAFRQLIDAQQGHDEDHRLRLVIFGGEALDPSMLRPWFERPGNAATQLVNMYGITETTVHVTYCPLSAADATAGGISPIGVRIPDLRVYVLDAQRQPVPLGVVGELYVGGAGVARGYLNRPDLTAERFLEDPFQPGARLYKSGDLARWRADGRLEYLGRNDEQVKIRGFRIELGEIQARLMAHPRLRDALVMAREDMPGDKRLVAYVIADDAQAVPSAAQLRQWLSATLSDYMVPGAFVALAAWPLTLNGKLDRKALPMPTDDAHARHRYEAPKGAVEQLLASLWSEVLQVEQVGRHDNFFELGGHSLLAVSLIERMRRHGLGTDVRVLFGQPTLAAIAAVVCNTQELAVPANRIPVDCARITPELLPLVELPQDAIDRIVASVPGGVANVQDIYPLAPLQEGVLYHHLRAGQGDPYLLHAQFGFADRSRLQAFVDALQIVIDRHDILRTAVFWEGLDQPVQVVVRGARLPVEEIVLNPTRGEAVEQLRARFDPRHYRLELGDAPLLRLVIADDPANQRLLGTLLFHHVVLDHTALEVVGQEMQAVFAGTLERLPAAIPYRNYVAQVCLGGAPAAHTAFFTRMLGDVDEPTLPFGLQDVQGDGSGIEQAELRLDAALSVRLRAQARKAGISVASLHHLAYARVLGVLSGRDDVVFGTVLMGRMQGGEGADRALGMFINTLPLRVNLLGLDVRTAVANTHAGLSELLVHEHASLATAQRCSGIAAPTPLFSALLNYRHSPVNDALVPDVALHGIEMLSGEERSNYPLTLNVDDLGEDFQLTVQVVAGVGAERACSYMQTALAGVVDALEDLQDRRMDQVSILPEADIERLVVQSNTPCEQPAAGALLHQIFEAQVAARPDAVAVEFGQTRLRYRQLNERANQVAHWLLGLGVRPDDCVALCAQRGATLLVGMLGILKAGAAYVPMDPAAPAERLRFMLDDSAPVAVLIDAACSAVMPQLRCPVLCIDASADPLAAQPTHNPRIAGLAPTHLAYVIYTSGSSGQPKGVLVEHRNVTRLFTATQAWFAFGAHDTWALFHSFAFDFSVWEIWGALLHGGRLLVVPQDVTRAPQECYALLCQAGVTVLNQTPSAFRQLIAAQGTQPHALRLVIFGGEALEPAMLQPWYARPQNAATQLVNMYGITETTVHVTYCPLSPADAQRGDVSPIGRRIPDLRLYVLDRQLQPVPIGVAGELYVGGAGVARGYLNRPELTAERFIVDPFHPGARLYKSGDLARWRADGTLDYLGRNDEQVKIRGFRIELGEIQVRLSEHPEIGDAVVVMRKDEQGDQQLVAYAIAQDPQSPPSAESLRRHLLAGLAEYMVPSAFVMLEAWPLTLNGKLDRKALPEPDGGAYAVQAYEPPQGEIEQAIAAIWSDLLGVETIGRHDNFFALGGHSLLAVRVIAHLRHALAVEIGVAELFAQPTLQQLAGCVASASGATVQPIVPLTTDAPHVLSYAQQRLWFLSQFEGTSQAYHISGGLRLHGALDTQALQRALDRIVARHASLRTTFAQIDGQVLQQITLEESGFALVTHDLRGFPEREVVLEQLLAEAAQTSFALERGPLIRGVLARLADTEFVLFVAMHHIVSDGWSIAILIDELSALYKAFARGDADPLAPLPIQYADYASWQRQWMTGEVLQQQASYWRQALDGAPVLLELPTDHPRPAQQDHAGERLEVVVDRQQAQALKTLSQRHGSTLYTTLLASWAMLLSRLSGQHDVVIGTPAANRGRAETEGLIGCFVNTLALRLDVSGAPTLAQLLASVKQRALQAQAHQDLPFEQVVELVQPPRSLSHTPLFQVMFAWQNTPQGVLDLGDLQAHTLDIAAISAQFDLTLSLVESEQGIVGSLIYATALFERATVERWLGHWRHLLQAMVAEGADDRPVDRLPLLDEAGRHHVVREWNATEVDYHAEGCVHALFQAQAARTPAAVAVAQGAISLSYGELNARANQLAHHLIAIGLRPDDRVAVCVQRSVEMVVALLAVLKAGGAYVPLDPAYPAERLAYMLDDCGAMAVLTETASRHLVDGHATAAIIDLQADGEHWAQCAHTNPDPDALGLTADHLAYVIYTSGSTGMPKGAMNAHRGVVNRLLWMQDAYQLAPSEVVLQKTPISFDVSVWELFWPLLSGARMQLAEPEGHKDPAYLKGLIAATQITTLHFVPSMLRAFVDHGSPAVFTGVRRVVCSGEALAPSLAERAQAVFPAAGIFNLYGPTEAAVDVTAWRYGQGWEQAGSLPIGRPIANTRIYILDAHGAPVPIGVVGELYIGGVGVGRGYLNRDDLTAERFLPDPFAADPTARMYRSGDLSRWRADGTIEYLGRNDHQVKIRGFRIELGEIEARLTAHAQVRECVVVALHADGGDKRLVAYWVGVNDAPSEACEVESLRGWLSEVLPEYMVPAAYVQLDALPLTPNGKLDRKALPAPDGKAYAVQAYEPPQGAVEQTLTEIWQTVLGVERVGRHDNFFQLGGHSLLAVTLIERMRRQGLSADMRVLFGQPTVAAIAAAVAHDHEVVVPQNRIPIDCARITPELLPLVELPQEAIDQIMARVPGGHANVQDIYPLAPLQEGVLYHHLTARQGDPYLLHAQFGFADRSRLQAFVDALQIVIDRHDILRTAVF
ncbi:non-ribosomal peptide synthetase, partial [Xanthomonas campestris]|uniref:non-ribosomal peptide synthetase n=1 Tax=Xanthomonas campestris TaxID=339 RepID=UPI00224C5911